MTTVAGRSIPLVRMPKYYTVLELADHFAVPERWVRDRIDEGVLGTPALTKGMHQYGKSAILRLSAYRALQATCGKRSPLPAEVVRKAGPRIDRIMAQASLYPVDLHGAMSDALLATIWTDEVAEATLRVADAEFDAAMDELAQDQR